MERFQDFRHWSPTEIKNVYTNEQKTNFKPSGLYFSILNDWIDWCTSSGYCPNEYLFQYMLDPRKELNILSIDAQSSAQFIREYEAKYPDQACIVPDIDWNVVASKYDGIHIHEEVIKQSKKNIGAAPTFHDMMADAIWSTYDVETLVIWSKKASLVFLQMSDPFDP